MRKLLAILLIICITLTGCARYQPIPLPEVKESEYGFSGSASGLKVQFKTYNKDNTRLYFESKLYKKDIYPVSVRIENESSEDLLFSLKYIDPQPISSYIAASKGRRMMIPQLVIGMILCLTIYTMLIGVPFVNSGCHSNQANRYMMKSYDKWEAKTQFLAPGEALTGVVFFKDHNPELSGFNVSLYNETSGEFVSVSVEGLGEEEIYESNDCEY